jgi:hypothetical protein
MSAAVSIFRHVIDGARGSDGSGGIVGSAVLVGGRTGATGGGGAGHAANKIEITIEYAFMALHRRTRGISLEHPAAMRLLAISLAATLSLGACRAVPAPAPASLRMSSDLPPEQLCSEMACGGSGQALPLSLIGIGVLFGFALLREAL